MKDLTSDNIHGQLGENPNKLYKSYVKWFKKHYAKDKKPMSFRVWLDWAIKKGVVKKDKNFSADAGKNLEVKIREIQMGYVLIGSVLGAGLAHVMKNKDKMGWFVTGGALAGVIVSLAIPRVKVTSSEEGKTNTSGGGGGYMPTNPSTPTVVVVDSTPVRKSVKPPVIGSVKTATQTGATAMNAANLNRPVIQTPTQPSTPPVGAPTTPTKPVGAPSASQPTMNATGCAHDEIAGCSLWATDKDGKSFCKQTQCRPKTVSKGANTINVGGSQRKYKGMSF